MWQMHSVILYLCFISFSIHFSFSLRHSWGKIKRHTAIPMFGLFGSSPCFFSLFLRILSYLLQIWYYTNSFKTHSLYFDHIHSSPLFLIPSGPSLTSLLLPLPLLFYLLFLLIAHWVQFVLLIYSWVIHQHTVNIPWGLHTFLEKSSTVHSSCVSHGGS